ncbi:MAG: hypothetical protein ACM3NQ_04930 [Bacteroidales bacterium]
MSRRIERNIEAWLNAEARFSALGAATAQGPEPRAETDSDRQADEALGRVFRRIERHAPRAGFSDTVLAAAGFAPVVAGAWPSWVRVALVGCLVAACLTVVGVPLLFIVLKPLAHMAAWPLATAVWRGVTRSAGFAFWCWSVVGDLATALRLSIATPTGAGLVLANVLIATASLFGLKRLLGNTRSFSNAS